MDAFFCKHFPHDDDATRRFHRQLHACLPDQGAVLDLGCGDLHALARYRTPNRQIWGTDFQAHPRLRDREWFRAMGRDSAIPFSAESFDIVAALWVLEHVAQPVRFLDEVSRVL